MSSEELNSVPVSAKISPSIRKQLTEASNRFGPTDSALIRMALEAFLPSFLAVGTSGKEKTGLNSRRGRRAAA